MPSSPLPLPRRGEEYTTADLVSARAEGRGAIRIVTADDRVVPLAHEPHSDADPLPWAEYDPDTGAVLRRHASRDCEWALVTDDTENLAAHAVERSVIKRLAAADVACARVGEGRDRTYGQVEFADGGYVTWSGMDRLGNEVSNLHPIADHGSFGGHWFSEVDDEETESFDFATGNYATDSGALVAHLIGLADRHGRAPAPII
ncbi:hypothetical protein SLUN_00100 [Streptomyces lunaelactis]|uniref:Uncharacterized protein n=1 Tax=Streptomyces lunaelactis TaxID=1535768 RepID=A0A2R4SVL6_9ACTN|nr:hypothetical protein [Streptomyces lunaelactis]AVZ70906.1 hypothetical protein SLUN_00100 [Streptomyces lunaelactis]NUK25162.1 hypothetical protein [Streptomyces lunaelactis]NUK85627.1 hypothetical protein [Streptomyces lunaelactis]